MIVQDLGLVDGYDTTPHEMDTDNYGGIEDMDNVHPMSAPNIPIPVLTRGSRKF